MKLKKMIAVCMTAAMVAGSLPASFASAAEFTDGAQTPVQTEGALSDSAEVPVQVPDALTDHAEGQPKPEELLSDGADFAEEAAASEFEDASDMEVFSLEEAEVSGEETFLAAGDGIVTNNEHGSFETALEFTDSITVKPGCYEEVYLKFTPSVTGEYQFWVNSNNNEYVSEIYVYNADREYETSWFLSEKNDEYANLEQGKVYYIGFDTSYDDMEVSVSVSPNVISLEYDKWMSGNYGEILPLTVKASGQGGALTYQWYLKEGREFLLIEGATEAVYQLDTKKATGPKSEYRCIISDSAGHFRTADFSVTLQSLAIEKKYHDVKCILGEPVTLRAEVSTRIENGDVRYQWEILKDGFYVAIDGATGPEYRIDSVTADTASYYYCRVSDGFQEEQISFNLKLTAGLEVAGQSYVILDGWPGDEMTLKVSATSTAPISYQWSKDGEKLAGETADSIHVVLGETDVDYACYVSDPYEHITREFSVRVYSEEDGKKPTRLELSPNERLWYIYEQSGGNIQDLVGFGDSYDEREAQKIKVIYEDGTTGYIDRYDYRTQKNIGKRDDGSWLAGEHSIVYSYLGRSVTLPIYVVRFDENGNGDLAKDLAKNGQSAGNTAKDYRYYRICPEKSGTYQISFSSVSGSGKAGVYQQVRFDNLGYPIEEKFEPLKEELISGDGKLACSLEAGVNYYVVVEADGASGVSYDIVFEDLEQELEMNKKVSLSPDTKYIFTFAPKTSGFYTLKADAVTRLCDEELNPVIRMGDRPVYLRRGRKYNVVMETYNHESSYYFQFSEEKEYPENIVTAWKNGAGTSVCTFSSDGVITCSGESYLDRESINYFWLLGEGRDIREIVVEEGITAIKDGFMAECKTLCKVTLPASLKKIEAKAFYNCTRLTELSFPKGCGLEEIGVQAVEGTPYLENQDGEEYVMLGTIVLDYRGETESTTVPEKATAIGGGAMMESDNLKTINIQEKLKRIGEFGMAYCNSLPSMKIPGNVTDIGYCAFYSDTALETVVLNEGVKYIDEEAFFACTSLKEITIPKSVTYIGDHAIGYIGANISTEEYYKDKDKNKLPTIKCYSGTVGHYYATNNDLPFVLLDEPKPTESPKPTTAPTPTGTPKPTATPKPAKSLSKGKTFVSGSYKYKVTSSGKVAFTAVNNKKTTKVNIGSTVKYKGFTYTITSVAAKALYNNKKITEVTVGNKVTTIGDNAFAGCTKLKKLTLGTGVTTIGKNAMKGDKKLTSIVIKSKKLKTVKANAFKGIAAKAKIKVPSSKLSAYKKLLKKKGQGSKVKITK